MRSSKSRSRSKQNRPRTLGNIINRVFDSSGPEGKVRGTPQQIIEKYQLLARDAQLSNDRVAAENFLQHAEHYTRLLAEANREMAAEQEARQQFHNQNGNANPRERSEYRGDAGQEAAPYSGADGFGVVGDDDSHLVDLPEVPRAHTQNQPRRDDNRPQQPRRDDNRRDDNRRRDDRPRDENRRDDRPRDDRPRDDRPRDENRRDDRPRDDRPREDRPRTEQPRAVEKPADMPVQAELPAFITGVVADPAPPQAEAPKPARAPRAKKPAAPKETAADPATGSSEAAE
jgi:hypothetical protein